MTLVVKPTFGINNFFRRQTPESQFSHFTGTDEELIALVELNFPLRKKGNREGAWRIPIALKGMNSEFMSSIKRIDRYSLLTPYTIESIDGKPIAVFSTIGPKQPAQYAEIILWSNKLLKSTGEACTEKDYEIVSVRASDVPEQPDHPYELAKNILNNPSFAGTVSVSDLCRSIVYWHEHAFVKKEFKNFIDQSVVKYLRMGDFKRAVEHRWNQVPQESKIDAQNYVSTVQEFLERTGKLYV